MRAWPRCACRQQSGVSPCTPAGCRCPRQTWETARHALDRRSCGAVGGRAGSGAGPADPGRPHRRTKAGCRRSRPWAERAGQARPRETERGGPNNRNTAHSRGWLHIPAGLFSTGRAYSWERQKGRDQIATGLGLAVGYGFLCNNLRK